MNMDININIYDAIRRGNITDVKKYISSGGNLYIENINILSRVCIHANRLDILKLLIDNGYDINHQNTNGYSALSLAAGYYKVEFLKYILSLSNCDVNLKTYNGGLTSLIFAIDYYPSDSPFKDYIETIKLLINAGCDLEYVMSDKFINRVKYGQGEIKKIIETYKIKQSLIRLCVIYIKKNRDKFLECEFQMLNRDIKKML